MDIQTPTQATRSQRPIKTLVATMNRRTIVVAAGAILLLAGCGSAATTTSGPATNPPTAAPPTAVPTADASVISAGYMAAYNTLTAAYNLDVAKQNRNNIGSQQLKDAVNKEAADHSNFDSAIQVLDTTGLPTIAADIQAVAAADANVETGEQTLALNSDSLSNFNSEFDIVQTALGAFASANSTAATALGLSMG